MNEWYENDADDDITVLVVLLQDRFYERPEVEDLVAYESDLDLSITALAADEPWIADWGGTNAERHTYTVVNSHGVITWRKSDGDQTTVDAVTRAAERAE